MKMIMAALTASAVLAGAALPASAESDVTIIAGEYVRIAGPEVTEGVKLRRYIPRQPEYIADKLPTGSSDWWRQMDREQRGGRR